MTIVRYEPWRLVSRLHREFDSFFDGAYGTNDASGADGLAWIPSVDVREEDDRFLVHADLPGVDPKDIEITAEKGVLTLRGERRSHTQSEAKGFERVERVTGTFLRRFTLPETANAEGISAKHVNGVLELTIPKQTQVQPKRINVEAA